MRGIIPARAGFTPVPITHGALPTDHPRSRGVYGAAEEVELLRAGSSPLARGLHAAFMAGLVRILDHPRSRGVYRQALVVVIVHDGSSPLARGLPAATSPAHWG